MQRVQVSEVRRHRRAARQVPAGGSSGPAIDPLAPRNNDLLEAVTAILATCDDHLSAADQGA